MALSLNGCAEKLASFPADYIFVVRPETQKCAKHKIIKKDPVTVDKGEWVPWSECPVVYGFAESDISGVMNWIRDAQELAKKRCK